jgi:PAS domain S-box-containing protein
VELHGLLRRVFSRAVATGATERTPERSASGGEQDHLARLLLDRITDGFVAFDREWRFVYLNRMGEAYFEQSGQQLVGQVLWEAFPAVRGTDVEREFRRAAAATPPLEFELRTPVRRRWMAFKAYPDEGGLSLYFRDVTLHRQAEAALRESEGRHRALFEHSLDGILFATPEGKILAANPAYCRMVGRSEQEVCALGREGVIDADDHRLASFLAERRQNGHARGELTLVSSDGSRIPVEVSSAVFQTAEGAERALISVHDLRERHRAEASLRFLAEVSASVAVSLDLDETIKTLTGIVVPALADGCALDVVEAGELQRLMLVSSATDASALSVVRSSAPLRPTSAGAYRVLMTGQPEVVPHVTDAWLQAAAQTEEHRVAARALEPRSILLVPLKVRETTIGVLSLGRSYDGNPFSEADLPLACALADRAAIAIENARLYRSALEARRLRDETLAIVSHDLRSPLSTIRLSAGSMADEVGERPELTKIRQAVDRANRLIDDLVTAAQVDAGHLPLSRRGESLGAIVDECLDLHRPIAETKHIVLGATVEANLPVISVDRHRWLQMLSNLVSNAIKFTPTAGRIEVGAQRTAEGVRLSVADTGVGIAPEALPHIFDRFWQAKAGRDGGAGLGLAIAKGIVEAHGGRLWAQSEAGRCATFNVSLPTS